MLRPQVFPHFRAVRFQRFLRGWRIVLYDRLPEVRCVIVVRRILHAVAVTREHGVVQADSCFLGEVGVVIGFALLDVLRNNALAVHHVVMFAFDTPIHQNLPFFGSQIIQELDDSNRILGGCRNAYAPSGDVTRVLERCILRRLIQLDRESRIGTVFLAGSSQCIRCIAEAPLLINDAKDAAGGNFSFVLVRLLHERFFINKPSAFI